MPSKPPAPPADEFIPLSVPELRGNEWKYIKECLDTNWVSSVGPFVERFERAVADAVDARHAVATVNGTAALHVALLVAGVRPGDEVLVSALTFIAPANAVRYVGAWPVFIDAESAYWQMDPQAVADFLEKECRCEGRQAINKTTGRHVRAILPVHILGHPVDLDPILDVAHRFNLVVIEDASESLGAQYKGRPVGRLGDIACFSFNGNKLITTGAGGMVVTDNEDWARKARYLTTQAKDDPIEYVHGEIGYNYRLSNILAALGCAQLENLQQYIETKRCIAATYQDALKDVPGVTLMEEAPWAFCTFWLFTVLIDEEQYGCNSRTLLGELERARIQSRPLWQPLHLSPAHKQSQMYGALVAEHMYKTALSLPSSVGLGLDGVRRVAACIRRTQAATAGG